MSSLHDPVLQKLYTADRKILENTQVPIVTVTGTFREDVKRLHGLPHLETSNDIVYSRAHFSMAYGTLIDAWNGQPDPDRAWLVDPTNYVAQEDLRKLVFTERVGEIIARRPLLKTVKDLIDKFGRSKLPILESITPPLLFLFEQVNQPILSFHVAAGNILVGLGKTVIQVITDPHVREEYLINADKKNLYLLVFDDQTKQDVLEKSQLLGKDIDPDRVIVTGPPIDQRLFQDRSDPKPHSPLRLLITTGGLGTNKVEIKKILQQLLPTLHQKPVKYDIRLYVGTEADFVSMAQEIAEDLKIKTQIVSKVNDKVKTQPQLTILHHPQIFDANEIIIKHGLLWADGVITKPSGDMAYDAIAAGCFLLTLQPWGVWEERIEELFRQAGVSRQAHVNQINDQLTILSYQTSSAKSWISYAMTNTGQFRSSFIRGTKQILKVTRRLG